MEIKSVQDKNDLITRLKKIEGQVKGIQKMIEEDKCCSDLMIQISAVRSAINKVGGMVMDKYIKECMLETLKRSAEKENNEAEINAMIDTIVRYVK